MADVTYFPIGVHPDYARAVLANGSPKQRAATQWYLRMLEQWRIDGDNVAV